MNKLREFLKNRKDPEVDEEYEEKLRKHRSGKLKKCIFLIGIVLLICIVFILIKSNKVYENYEIEKNIMKGDTTKCKFYQYNGYFVRYSNDGLAYINGNDTVWNQAFEMKNPVIDICKEYIAIAEQKTNLIYILDEKGSVGKVKTTYPIINLEVAAQGVVAAVTENEDKNYIELLDKSGKLLAKGQTVLSGDGCPVDFSISEDGTKLVVSYLYVNSGVTQTRVVFYNYSEVGKNEVDRIVGGFNQYKTTIVPKVEFITNDIAVAFGDDMFTIYSVKQKPMIILEEKHSTKLESIMYNEEYIGFVYEREKLNSPYQIKIYSTEGKLIYDGMLDFEYKTIKLDGSNIIAYNNDTMLVQTVKGDVKYKQTIDMEINEVIGIEGGYEYILITKDSIDEIVLK